jgi:hypothetical protein
MEDGTHLPFIAKNKEKKMNLEDEYNKLLKSMIDQLEQRLNTGDINQSEFDALCRLITSRIGYEDSRMPGWDSSSSSCYGEQNYDYDDNDGWNSSGC